MKRMWQITETVNARGSGIPNWRFLSALALSMLIAGSVQATGLDSRPTSPPVPEPSTTQYDYSSQTLRVGVWLDKSEDEVYRRGENLSVGVQTNEDGYAVVYRIDTEGLVTILWPRSRMDDGFVFGGHEYALPVSGSRRLKVSGQEGLGYVEAIVSSYPFDLRDLEIDFHHENRSRTYDFFIAGDPFLAMNEVNFAVTGLEDATDFVVTNYASYYVHEKVDHPRYLCNQCHYDDDVAYHPYRDHCSLDIRIDFGWSNSWYDHYGYYPSYWQPTYIYVDPWTWRPWVNFWYYPSYRCAPYPYYTWAYSANPWYYSPYYVGDSYYYWNSGLTKYSTLGPIYDDGSKRKIRDYTGVSGLVKSRSLDKDQRVAMKTRTPLANKTGRGGVVAKDGIRTVSGSPVKGERPIVRARPEIGSRDQVRVRPGLRVRDSGRGGSNVRPNVRHTAGGSKTRPALTPVSGRTSTERSKQDRPGVRGERPVPERNGSLKGRTRDSQGTIKPVEPRKKGTRVWNRGSSRSELDRSKQGSGSKGSVRDSRSSDPGRSGSKTVRPKPSGRDGGSSKVSPTPRKSGSDSSRSSKGKSSPKVRETKSSSSSSGVRSNGGSSRRSNSSSGGKSGSSSKRSGGDSRRR